MVNKAEVEKFIRKIPAGRLPLEFRQQLVVAYIQTIIGAAKITSSKQFMSEIQRFIMNLENALKKGL